MNWKREFYCKLLWNELINKFCRRKTHTHSHTFYSQLDNNCSTVWFAHLSIRCSTVSFDFHHNLFIVVFSFNVMLTKWFSYFAVVRGAQIRSRMDSAVSVASAGSNSTPHPVNPTYLDRTQWNDFAQTLALSQSTLSCLVWIFGIELSIFQKAMKISSI